MTNKLTLYWQDIPYHMRLKLTSYHQLNLLSGTPWEWVLKELKAKPIPNKKGDTGLINQYRFEVNEEDWVFALLKWDN